MRLADESAAANLKGRYLVQGTIGTPRYQLMIVISDARASPSQRDAILPAARALRVAFNLKSV